jgi:predicted transcriptional regulator
MQKKLSALEQLVMDYVWAHPDCTADACREALAASSRELKESTVRTLLRRLEDKGYLTHQVEGRTYLYRAREARHTVAAQAVKQVMDRFWGGSVEQLLTGMVDNDFVDRKELERLAQKIAAKKKERK